MNKKQLEIIFRNMKRNSETRLKSLQTRAADPKLSADDAKALQDAVDQETKAHQEVVDQLAALTGDGGSDDDDDTKSDDDDSNKSDDNTRSNEDDDEENEDEDQKRSALIDNETRDGILAGIKNGLESRGKLSKIKKDEQIRSAFAQVVVGKMGDEEARSLGIVAGNGSVTVPEVVASEILTYAQEENLLRKYGTVVRTKGDVKYPVLVKKAKASGHKSELTDDEVISQTEIEFDEIQLSPTEFDALATVTKKLLNMTGLPVESIVMEELRKAYVRQESNYMFNGDDEGNENPGALSKKAVVFTPSAALDVTSATGGQQLYDALIEMKNTVPVEVMKKSRFVLNRAALTLVEKMKTTDGFPLLRPMTQAEGGIGQLLVGYPVDFTDNADKKDSTETAVFYFGDFKTFYIQDVIGAMEVQKLIEKYADSNRVGFKIYNLLDGQLIYSPLEPSMYKLEIAPKA